MQKHAAIRDLIEPGITSIIHKHAALGPSEFMTDKLPVVAEHVALQYQGQIEEIAADCFSRELFPELPAVKLYGCDGKGDAVWDIWLMMWRRGILRPEATSIHDHGASSAGIYVLKGKVSEYIYRVDKLDWQLAKRSMTCRREYRLLKAGDTAFIPMPYIHRMMDHIEEGYGVHVYGNPPLDRQTSYLQYGGRLYRDREWEEPGESHCTIVH